MERGLRFYEHVFNATVLVPPFTVEGEFAEMVTGGPAGVRWRTAIVAAGTACIELFEFQAPIHAVGTVHPSAGNLIHFGMQVRDVPGTVARVEAAGGRRLWPQILDLAPGVQVIYIADPDENIVELLNVDAADLAATLNELIPGRDPEPKLSPRPTASTD